MPIYNNPALGQAFSQISQLFAPPSGSEAAGWAMANARNAEARREAEAYARMTAPGVDPATVDRYGIATGAFAPAQSYGLTIRDQDINSADRRYGSDRTYAASTENNVRDNARTLEAERVKTVAGLFGPLSQGQLRPEVPEAIAGQLGLDAAVAPAYGLPDPLSSDELVAQIMSGMPKAEQQGFVRDKFAPSETQVQGQERRRLAADGLLSDEMLLDTIIGERSPVEAIVNGRNTFLSPGAAIRTGAEPAPSKPLVSVNTAGPADGDLRKKLDEAEGKRWSNLQAAAVTSAGLQQDMELLSELIDQAPQGPIIGRLSEYFPEATTAGAAFQSIVSRAAPGLRVEGSGSTSDIEYAGMMKSLPRLRNQPEGNRLIVQMMQAKADINIRRGEIVNAYQTGEIDAAEARRRLAEINSRSIMTPELRTLIGGAAEAPDAPDGAGDPAMPRDGVIAVNPSTGERIILRNGQWEPYT